MSENSFRYHSVPSGWHGDIYEPTVGDGVRVWPEARADPVSLLGHVDDEVHDVIEVQRCPGFTVIRLTQLPGWYICSAFDLVSPLFPEPNVCF